MCRLVAYLGLPVLLQRVLVDPKNSIVLQSLRARETNLRTNGDGFGLGWYAPEISSDPALFTSISPAWNDRNLLNIAAKVQSPCFFAHVRSASAGGVTNYNCHPFIYGDWMLMHNGEIYEFALIKRHLRHLLEDDIYSWIKGDTDSEHLFALFLQLAKGRDLSNLSIVAETLQETLQTIEELMKQFGKKGPSYYNICLTDGHRIVATRYCTRKTTKPLSLHYLEGYLPSKDGTWEKITDNSHPYVVISSEKLNDLAEGWQDIPAQSMMLVERDRTVRIREFQLS